MRWVPDYLLRHGEEKRVGDKKRLVQERKETRGGEKQCGPRTGKCRHRRNRLGRVANRRGGRFSLQLQFAPPGAPCSSHWRTCQVSSRDSALKVIEALRPTPPTVPKRPAN